MCYWRRKYWSFEKESHKPGMSHGSNKVIKHLNSLLLEFQIKFIDGLIVLDQINDKSVRVGWLIVVFMGRYGFCDFVFCPTQQPNRQERAKYNMGYNTGGSVIFPKKKKKKYIRHNHVKVEWLFNISIFLLAKDQYGTLSLSLPLARRRKQIALE